MNVECRIAELANEEGKRRHTFGIGLVAVLLLYASLFVAAFDHHKLLAVCVTVCLAICLRSLLRTHALHVEERVLRSIKENAR